MWWRWRRCSGAADADTGRHTAPSPPQTAGPGTGTHIVGWSGIDITYIVIHYIITLYSLLIKNPLKNGTDFHSPIFSKELVHYNTFISNFRYKQQIFMVPTSSL